MTLAGTLAVNSSGTFANGTTFDLVRGGSLTGTFDGIANGGFYTFGDQIFAAQYTGTDFLLVAVPELATWASGGMLLIVSGLSLRRRMYAKLEVL